MSSILIVDDSLMDRRLVGGLLDRQAHLEVKYACDGLQALQMVADAVPDMVLTDLNMPGLDGLELVKSLHLAHPEVPVVVMTAVGSEEIAVAALAAGAASYVTKNRLATTLVQTVDQVLSVAQEHRLRRRIMNYLTEQRIEFQIDNDQELIGAVIEYLQDTAADVGAYSPDERIRVGVALQEAMTNACFHGNLEVSSSLREIDHRAYYELARSRKEQEPYASRKITVEAIFSSGEVRFTISDDGPGFDPGQLPDPTDPKNLERPCGRGLLLMQTFMDEVRFLGRGNRVELVKRSGMKAAA
jgi:CheY-like chemotaxis protein